MAVAVRAVGTVASDVGAIAPGLLAGTATDNITLMIVETYNATLTVPVCTEKSKITEAVGSTDTRLIGRGANYGCYI